TAYRNSGGMIRYAGKFRSKTPFAILTTFGVIALLLEELKQVSTKPIRERLEQMPKGIEGMYDLICSRLYACCKESPDEQAMLRKLLTWMAVTTVPLTVGDMQWMLITTPEQP